jgi:large subunit ribosomal protein L29
MARKEEKSKSKSREDKKKVNYAELSIEELNKSQEDLRKELYELRVKVKVSSLPEVHKIRKNKKNIARILTVLRQREVNEHK